MDLSPLSISDYDSFLLCEKLNKVEDPDATPYKSKYEARSHLETLRLKLNLRYISDVVPFLSSSDNDSLSSIDLNLVASFAYILYKLGANHFDTDERTSADQFFTDCLKVLEKLPARPETIFVFISAENHLSFIHSDRSKNDDALNALLAAQTAYNAFKELQEVPVYPEECLKTVCAVPLSCETITEPNHMLRLEQLYTYTMFYLAQLFKNMEQFEKSALLCHETLVRQLNFGNYDSLEWSLNSATLSQYYITDSKKLNFTVSRQCLTSALAMLEKVDLEKFENAEDKAVQQEKLDQCRADIYRCFGKYGMALLEASSSVVFNDGEEQPTVSNHLEKEEVIMFEKLDYVRHEKLMTNKLVVGFEGARAVYLAIQNCLNKAKQFYTLDTWASDHASLVQDHSRALKLLSAFEPDAQRRRQMHKRRVEMLDELLKQLNPQHFRALCRQLYIDLAEAHAQILDAKIDQMEQGNIDNDDMDHIPDSKTVCKVNLSAQQAIKFYDLFLESYKNAEDQLPLKFDESSLRPIVVAQLNCGRLYNKLLTSDKRQKAVNCQKALERFRWIVNYCENSDTDSAKLVPNEFEVARDLLPVYAAKIDRLRII